MRSNRTGLGAGGSANRSIIAAVAALLIIGGAVVWRAGVNSQPPAGPVKAAVSVKNPAIDELMGTTKALDASQQQVVDQLQVVQEMLATQQAETKRSSDKIAALGAQLEALRQSFASLPPAVPEETEAVSAKPGKKIERRSGSRAKIHRAAPARKVARSKRHRVASSRR